MLRATCITSCIVAVLALAPAAAYASPLGAWIEVEAGPAWQSRNDVQIPADTGSRFSLRDLGSGPVLAYRAYAGVRLDRHELRALWAPLTIDLDGRLRQPTSFQGVTFDAASSTDARYRFDSYRLTYRYALLQRDRWTVKLGFTGKIRDAEVRLEQGGRVARRSNTGFVPLLHLSASWRFAPSWELLLDADALAAPQGRAEDVALLVGWSVAPDVQLRAGYRTVEGGADGTGGVYSFAWLHYGVAGLAVEF
jgi:hypothetical protein